MMYLVNCNFVQNIHCYCHLRKTPAILDLCKETNKKRNRFLFHLQRGLKQSVGNCCTTLLKANRFPFQIVRCLTDSWKLVFAIAEVHRICYMSKLNEGQYLSTYWLSFSNLRLFLNYVQGQQLYGKGIFYYNQHLGLSTGFSI